MVDSIAASSQTVEYPVDASGLASSSRRSLTEPVPGKPTQHFEIAETSVPADESPAQPEDETVYPTGLKFWLSMSAMMLCAFLRGLDITIVSVAVPSITNDFKTIRDIGWYSAVNGIVVSSTCFFFGKVYSVFDVKRAYLLSIAVFWLGAVICTFTPTSRVFILGRSIVALGFAGQGGGVMTQLNTSVPLQKRPIMLSLLMFIQSLAMVGAPIIGGGLIRRFGWRACFGINVPLNILVFVFTAYGMQRSANNPDVNLPLWEKIKRLDLLGTLLVVPAVTCLLVGLQWGGTKYGWSDVRIIALLVVAVVLLGAFGYVQYRLQDKALLPPRILKQRSILAGAWFMACCDGTLACTEYFISVYFQGVRGLSPVRAGILFVPMIVGLLISNIVSGPGIAKIGYYSPFMLFTSAVAPIASGLLTTLDLDSQLGKAAGLLALLGFAVGIGMSAPSMAVSVLLKPADVGIGSAIITFGAGMGSSLFISTATTLFQNRLGVEVGRYSPGTNITTLEAAGLSDIRNAIGQDRLKQVLIGYDKATVQTLYIPLALTVASIVGSTLTEWRSVKKKQS